MYKTDKLQCRSCKQRPPNVEIRYVKGKPQGECKACNRLRQIRERTQNNLRQALAKGLPEFIHFNIRTLGTVANGVYALTKFSNRQQVGYIIVQNSSIFVNLHNQADLFTYDLYAVASYLANAGAFIDLSVSAETQSPIALDELGRFEPKDAAERLIWLDKALLVKAAKLLKAEVRAIQAIMHVQKTPSDSGNASD